MRLKPGFRIGSSFQARFNDQGSRLAAIGRGRRGALWDVERRAKIGFFPQLKHTSSVSFSPDGSLLACKNTYGDILVVDVATLTEHTHVPGKAYGEGADVHFSPCGRYLVDGSWQGHLLVREVRSGAVVWEEFVEGTTVSELTCCRDRQVWAYTRTVVGERPAGVVVRAWPFSDHQPRTVTRKLATLRAVALSAHGDLVATADTTMELEIWAPGEPSPRHRFADGRQWVHALSWAPDDNRLALSAGKVARIFSSELEPLFAHELDYPSDVDWSPDGRLLAAGDWGAGVVLPWPPP